MEEGTLLDHTTARDLICEPTTGRWAAFLRAWEPKRTVAVPTPEGSERHNIADVVLELWTAVHFMVVVARKDHPTPQERVRFAEVALDARCFWRALNPQGSSYTGPAEKHTCCLDARVLRPPPPDPGAPWDARSLLVVRL